MFEEYEHDGLKNTIWFANRVVNIPSSVRFNNTNKIVMPNEKKINNTELRELMGYISSQYTQEEIDWYLSLTPQSSIDNNVEIKVSNNSYADEK